MFVYICVLGRVGGLSFSIKHSKNAHEVNFAQQHFYVTKKFLHPGGIRTRGWVGWVMSAFFGWASLNKNERNAKKNLLDKIVKNR
jgi:hypothetical protein